MKLRAVLSAPALHFLLLGALLHGGEQWWQARQLPEPIVVSADDRARLRRDWRAETGRWPTAAELAASEQRWLDEEVLLAEALRLGLDRSDPVVRQRLLQNLRFALVDEVIDEPALLDQAQALRMPEQDLVVRRRLIQRMEQRLLQDVRIDEAELRRYVARHAGRYAGGGQLDYRQIYFSRDRPGGDAAAQAGQALARLRAGAEPAGQGDPLLVADRAASAEQLQRRYGAAFAQALEQAAVGDWIGPLETVYGWHLLQLRGRIAAPAPDFETLRQRAAYAWLAEQEPALLRQRLRPLRQRYGLTEAGRS
ncbi:MAG: peptidylprolyl isomerase [Stagnimonas sp.]|nr:peptidylprolyl isomerase [Stagnimonas sp.]